MTTTRPIVVAPPQTQGTVVPNEFGLVAGVAALSTLVHYGYMGYRVVKARKETGIKPPTLYASESDCSDEAKRVKYNCTQRAHQNSLEFQPAFLAMMSLAGLKHPKPAAAIGAVYLAFRVAYMERYHCNKESKKRSIPFYGSTISLTALTCLCLSAGATAVYACMRNK